MSAAAPVVLVADDDDEFRAALVEVLELHDGWRILEAQNGTTALQMALAETPSAVVLDHRMPGLTGSEVVRRLREGGSQVPVVLVTAASDVAQIAESLDLCGYLGKPFSVGDLVALLHRAIKGEC